MAGNQTEPRSEREEWLSLEQTAEVLGMPPATVRRRALEGATPIPAYQFWDEGNNGRVRFRFRKSDVESFHARVPAQEPSAEARGDAPKDRKAGGRRGASDGE